MNSCSVEFLFSGYDIKSKYKMKEGILPVPNTVRLERCDVVPLRALSHFLGSRSSGGETSFGIQVFFEYFL